MKLLIINGPNLNLLGQREKGIYGERTFESYLEELRGRFPGVTIDCYQSNIEGEIVDRLHASQDVYDGVVINAGAYTHTSIAIADAIGGIRTPVVEVHISCILAREEYRHVADRAQMQGVGHGLRTRLVPARSAQFHGMNRLRPPARPEQTNGNRKLWIKEPK